MKAISRASAGTVYKSTKFTTVITHGGINGSEDSLLIIVEIFMSPVVLITGGGILPSDVGCIENSDLLNRSHIQNLKLRLYEITSPPTSSGFCMEAVCLQILFFSCFSSSAGFDLDWFNAQDSVKCSLLSIDNLCFGFGQRGTPPCCSG